MKLTGHAAIFNSWSVDLGGFREIIRPGAFATAISSGNPIFAVHHHEFRDVLASTQAASMKLAEDRTGLHFEITLPDTSLARDIHALVQRGDIRNMSFSFRVNGAGGENWTDPGPGKLIERELLDVDLFEISTVARAAYPATRVSARSAPTAKATARNAMARRLMQTRLRAVA